MGSDEDDKSSIMMRFPDGKRESQKFPCTSRLKALILFVQSRGFSDANYEIVTNFPRRVLSDLDGAQTLKDLGLFPQEMVFVQEKSK